MKKSQASPATKASAVGPSKLTPADVFGPASPGADHQPTAKIWLVPEASTLDTIPGLGSEARQWLSAVRFSGAARKQALIPGGAGRLAGAALGLGNGNAGDPCGPSELLMGQLAQSLPPETYEIANACAHPNLAALAWGLGAYRFRRYKSAAGEAPARLTIPATVDRKVLINTLEAIWLGRDLINTPASDLGPQDIEDAARALATSHGASISVITGDELLRQNFPMIHAVGRASPRPPRLIDMAWQKPGGRKTARTVTLVGKGITFDTGGLDIKPSSAMLIMKKDMGGAATVLALAHMIMGQGLDVRLRVLIAAAENSISGDAFRPGDVLQSRAGKTVEIGNTDAEGRLVLADALALADSDKPDLLMTFATLTGAARVALGPDLPALFTDDSKFAGAVVEAGLGTGDPVWRLPFWPGYERHLDSDVADMNNVWEAPFAGAITAALFLRRFVKSARTFAHFDLYGWRSAARPLGPKGGDPQTARAVFEVLKQECGPA
ncbi:MAG: leucyl aminopeptidase family protein [Hyphomicrobium sp.]